MGRFLFQVLCVCLCLTLAAEGRIKRDHVDYESYRTIEEVNEDYEELDYCQCGVFLSQQVGIKEGRRGRPRGPPRGEPVITYDTEDSTCGFGGFRSCVNKCLDVILMYLPKAGPVICGAVERDVHREKAFLFIKSCGGDWTPTTFSAGKEFCCTNGEHHKC